MNLRALIAVLVFAGAALPEARQVFVPGNGVTAPVATKQVRSSYTPEAMERRIQGTVTLDCVVLDDGTVGELSVSQSLDNRYGLDLEAVKALRQWQFAPGTRDGKPVAVRIAVAMPFSLR